MNRALPAKVAVIQAGHASEGGWARLTPTVSPPTVYRRETFKVKHARSHKCQPILN